MRTFLTASFAFLLASAVQAWRHQGHDHRPTPPKTAATRPDTEGVVVPMQRRSE